MREISVGQAVRNAIEAERAAARFYAALREATTDGEAREFLEELVRVELTHAASIEAFAASGEFLLPAREELSVVVIETAPGWEMYEGLNLQEALTLAHESEIQASLYYDAIADAFEGDARHFFLALAATETQHAELISARMGDVGDGIRG